MGVSERNGKWIAETRQSTAKLEQLCLQNGNAPQPSREGKEEKTGTGGEQKKGKEEDREKEWKNRGSKEKGQAPSC